MNTCTKIESETNCGNYPVTMTSSVVEGINPTVCESYSWLAEYLTP